jgi:hypothetical protein
MPPLFAKPGKPSESTFGIAVCLAVGMNLMLARSIFEDVQASGFHWFALPIYLLLWNALPVVFFLMSRVFKKQGR